MDLKKYKHLINEIEKYDKNISIDDTKENRRNILMIGFFETIKCHYKSIVLLIEQKQYHSAFALVRVLFESIVRSKYFYIEFDEDKINEFYDSGDWDKFFKGKFPKMCETIDEKYYNERYYQDIKKNSYSKMCDFTHTGNLSIALCFTDNKIKPNFDDDSLYEVLEFVYDLTKIFYLFLFENTFIKHNIIEKAEIESFYESTK